MCLTVKQQCLSIKSSFSAGKMRLNRQTGKILTVAEKGLLGADGFVTLWTHGGLAGSNMAEEVAVHRPLLPLLRLSLHPVRPLLR